MVGAEEHVGGTGRLRENNLWTRSFFQAAVPPVVDVVLLSRLL
jgi:hypothetical protein